MIYGTDKPPDRAVFGTPTAKQLEQDQKVTDTQKAYFAHTGQSKQKIKRPFYAGRSNPTARPSSNSARKT